ncbi:hypothetical protein NPIL_182941 [Nephila pilipes]|uniref:Uncharacterized protein n=1 Tax=Nephila pilipes TaxID=299642 RepID=A0A8X6TZ97_NEPPI|nr:hypothetical protein NPIL_675971 [Nephila pilipes]GFT73613.1 hypothetical protein NPIL_182941 [Nephila pilipes]
MKGPKDAPVLPLETEGRILPDRKFPQNSNRLTETILLSNVTSAGEESPTQCHIEVRVDELIQVNLVDVRELIPTSPEYGIQDLRVVTAGGYESEHTSCLASQLLIGDQEAECDTRTW